MKNFRCIAGLIPRRGDVTCAIGVVENGAACWENEELGVDMLLPWFLCRSSIIRER